MSTLTLPRIDGPAVALAAGAGLVAVAAVVAGDWTVIAGVAVSLPVLVWVWARPQRGLLLLAALLPFDGLLLLVENPPVVDAWKEAILGFTLIAALVGARRQPWPRRVPSWVVPLVVLATLAAFSAAFVSPLRAGVGMKVMFTGVGMAVVAWRCPLDERERDQLVTVLAVVGALAAVVGLTQQALGHQQLRELGYLYNSTIRFVGGSMRSWSTFNQPFPYAFFLMLVMLVCGAVALERPLRSRNALILLAMPLYVAGLAVSYVRAAWFGLAAGVIYLAITRYRTLLRATPLAVAGLVIALVLGSGSFFASASLFERFDRWSSLPAATAEAPLGQGIGSAGAAAARAEVLAGGTPTFAGDAIFATEVVYQPDNHYFKMLYELGLAGLLAFVTLLLAIAAGARRAERDPAIGAFAAGTSALVVAAAVASFASTFFEVFPVDYLFWLVVGVGAIGRTVVLPNTTREVRS